MAKITLPTITAGYQSATQLTAGFTAVEAEMHRLVAENGMDWMFSNCSTTAQRGALDWSPKFRDAVAPVFDDLYQKVTSGKETKRVLEANSTPDYREKLDKELDVLKNSEMWQTGATVRSLRPENRKKV